MARNYSFSSMHIPVFCAFTFYVGLFAHCRCKIPVPVIADWPHMVAVQNKNLIPEGIAVHPVSGDIYLSSLHENKIVIVDKAGNCKDLIAANQGGFMRGLGIKISRDGKTLWACSSTLDTIKSFSGLFQVDLSTGKMVRSVLFKSDSTSLFNDLTIHSSGDIYLTDTYQSSVFRFDITSNTLERWLFSDLLTFANGIALSPDEKILFVASGDKGVQRIDMQTKEITPVVRGKSIDYAIDGLLCTNNALIGVIGWPQNQTISHRIIRYRLSDDYYMATRDTIAINEPYLVAPTTAAFHKDQLFVLGKTNLGLYNRGQQSLDLVRDSLEFPIVVQIPL